MKIWKMASLICILVLVNYLLLQSEVLGQNFTLNGYISQNEKQSEKKIVFDKLKERLVNTDDALTSSNAQIVSDGKKERLVVIKELKKWAKKYKVKLQQISESESIKTQNGNISSFKPCVSVMEKSELICLVNFSYFDHSSNNCVYQCLLKKQVE